MCRNATHYIHAFLCICLTVLTSDSYAQDQSQKEVEILNADYLRFQELNEKKITSLVGDVRLKQDDVYMWCDSAHLDKETNSVDAWGSVRITQDTVTATSNTLRYEGSKKFATLRGNARIIDPRMVLTTEELFYDVKGKTAYYLNKGRVVRDSTVIDSRKAHYYSQTSEVYFKGDVRIKDPDYTLTSDTLRYNTQTKVSTFYGNTEIINKDSRIQCNNGWYDSERDVSAFGKNTVIYNPPQRIAADSLYYERFRGFGRAIGRFHWVDSTMETELLGNYAEYYDEKQFIVATQKPLLIYKMDKDSLFLTADTLKSINQTAKDTIRNFYAYYKVRMYMKDMQGMCDSLFYSFSDSTFRMFYNPVLWSDDTQMTGDTIYLTTRNKKAEKLSIYNAGFIITPSGRRYYDQIKGIDIFGYFNENELAQVDVIGNAQSIYFGKDEKDKYIGSNKALSSTISIYFKDKKIDRITFRNQPEAVFTPIQKLQQEQTKLDGFKWYIEQKPKSRDDIWTP